MLAIRMQRTGRKGHAQFRIVVQDSRLTPSSGRFVALLGSYDPHAKTTTLAKDKAEFYLSHGAQPSDRVIRLFQAEGVKLPGWVKLPTASKQRGIRNPEKLRKNQPKTAAEEPSAEVAAPAAAAEAEASTAEPAEETAA